MPTKGEKIFKAVMSGKRDTNIPFREFQLLLDSVGFVLLRVSGDHFIYAHNKIDPIINIQPERGKAKAYQVKQVRNIIKAYRLEVQA